MVTARMFLFITARSKWKAIDRSKGACLSSSTSLTDPNACKRKNVRRTGNAKRVATLKALRQFCCQLVRSQASLVIVDLCGDDQFIGARSIKKPPQAFAYRCR